MKKEKNSPQPMAVRALNPEEMHAYAIQITYSNHEVRNYYLKVFRTYELPEQTEIDGYLFTPEILQNVSLQPDGDIRFPNLYRIPVYNCMHDSFPQLVPVPGDHECIYEDENLRIEALYLIPKESMGRGQKIPGLLPQWGFDSIRRPPSLSWLGIDSGGHRQKDLSICDLKGSHRFPDADLVCAEPGKRCGYLNHDGTWRIPPVYDRIDENYHGLCAGVRKIHEQEVFFQILEDGREKMLMIPDFVGEFRNDRAPFNIGDRELAWDSPQPPEYYVREFVDMIPGEWGFVDSCGNIIVEPKYLYVTGFACEDSQYTAVARKGADGALWGILDRDGKEVIPCRYVCLILLDEAAAAFQEEPYGLYGLMDLDEKRLVDPIFYEISEYDSAHGLIIVREEEDVCGVYSVGEKRMLIPSVYSDIAFEPNGICAYMPDGKYILFDYDGNRRNSDEEIAPKSSRRVLSYDGFLLVQEDGAQAGETKDSLLTPEGQMILDGDYSHMAIDEKTCILTCQAPDGFRAFRLIRKGETCESREPESF